MVSINDLTSKIGDSPVKKTAIPETTTISSRSDKLKQPSLKDYEEWMKMRANDLNIDHLKGLIKYFFNKYKFLS